jgi:hypothetical protein
MIQLGHVGADGGHPWDIYSASETGRQGPLQRWIFRISGRRFGAIGVDFRGSRRAGWISAGRVRPRFAPRGPGVIWEPLLEVGILGVTVGWGLITGIFIGTPTVHGSATPKRPVEQWTFSVESLDICIS